MKVVLVFPPHTDPGTPALALPTLASALDRAGHCVKLRDENLNAFERFLSKDYLSRMQARCLDALKTWKPEDGESHLQTLLIATLTSGEVLDRLDELLVCLRSHLPLQKRLWAQRLFLEALHLIGAAHYPTRLTLTDFSPPYSALRSAEVLEAIDDARTNPFLEFFEERSVPGILAESPDAVGISITFPAQLIPAFTLARCLRRASGPGKPHLIVGGGLIARLADSFPNELLRLVDSVGLYDGETTLPALLHALETGESLRQVPNLLAWLDGERVETARRPLSLRQAAPPNFDGLRLDRYLSPEPVVPLQTARGCYWGRCTFCAIHTVNSATGQKYRPMNLDGVVDSMARLAEAGYRRFFFVDECIPAPRLRALAEKILERGLQVRWFCWVRFGPDFDRPLIDLIARAGCALVSFGLESVVPEVLERMRKGASLEEVDRILEDCQQAGLAVIPNFFVGFPGETREQAQQTLDFVLRNRARFRHVVWGQFCLERSSPIDQHPDEYGLTDLTSEGDLDVHRLYRPTRGMTLEEIRAQVGRTAAALAPIYHPILGTLAYVDSVKLDDFTPALNFSVTPDTRLRSDPDLRVLLWSANGRAQWQIASGNPLPDPEWEPRGALVLDRTTGRSFALKQMHYRLLRLCDGRQGARGLADALNTSTEQVAQQLTKFAAFGLVFPVLEGEAHHDGHDARSS